LRLFSESNSLIVSLFPYDDGGNSFVPNTGIPNFVIIYEPLKGCRKSQSEEHVTSCAIRRVSCANTEKKTQEKRGSASTTGSTLVNPLNPELNPICYLLALLAAHHFLHVSRIRVKSLTLRRLMSYIYGAPILDVSRSHTTTQHSR